MRKMFSMALVATAAIAMMSCSQEDAFDAVSANGTESDAVSAVEFTTYLGRNVESRAAAAITTVNLTAFGVFASYTGSADFTHTNTPNFMCNQKVTKSDNAWTYSPLKYWPTTNGDKVSFFAYAPYDTNDDCLTLSANNATGAPTITVDLSDLSKSVDLVAAAQLNKTATINNGAADKVEFTLKHVMSRLAITANVSEDVYAESGDKNKTYVFVRKVEFKTPTNGKLYTNGTYTFASTAEGTGSWSTTTAATSALAATLNTEAQSISGVTNYPGQLGNSVKLEGKSSVSLFGENSYLYLIPVTGMTVGAIEADITYDIVTVDAALNGGASVTSATKTVKVPATCALEQGKAYSLNFTIHVHGVEVSATVADWTDATANADVEYATDDKSNTEE